MRAATQADAEGVTGAGFGQRPETYTEFRNGSEPLSIPDGDLEPRIPRQHTCLCFQHLLERLWWIEQALFAVVVATLACGVVTRKGHHLFAAPGTIARSLVGFSRISKDLG